MLTASTTWVATLVDHVILGLSETMILVTTVQHVVSGLMHVKHMGVNLVETDYLTTLTTLLCCVVNCSMW